MNPGFFALAQYSARVTKLEAQNARLVAALKDAAKALENVSGAGFIDNTKAAIKALLTEQEG
jgi:hypothetical protein